MKKIVVKSRVIGAYVSYNKGHKMEITVKELSKTSNYTLDYIFKLLRESCINSRILLNKCDLIKLRQYLKTNCNTTKRYKLYIYVNRFLTEHEVA